MSKVLIAMSGGVDSSVSAALMMERGNTCMGVTMKLYDRPEDTAVLSGKTCCSLDDVEDARAVAQKLGMPYYVFNFQLDFTQQVINRFVQTYEFGATPNPCIDCNRYLKFERLYQRAKTLGCDKIVTGHYARIAQDAKTGRYLLKKARNADKDQSYVLYFLSQEQLAHTCFPLGDYESKEEIRAIAEKYGFCNARKRDSQDICFVPDGDYVHFMERYTGHTYPCGNFCDLQGNVLGQHQGIVGYTIGQRKGLGLSLGKPMYVCDKCKETNTVYLGENADLFSTTLTAHCINLISVDRIDAPMRVSAKIRYNQKAQPATVVQLDADTLQITFDAPQRAIARGQAVVLYEDDVVVGGGVIA
jgi:tRNA-specific 2-thiouridylase